ncbi:MAG: glycosyltransferase, partial [Clostridiales bacterium]|nr:glycosyltransferase [Clostridiales bacterium]
IGELFDDIKEKVMANGLEDSVKFLGFRDDVTNLLQGMDVFLMPSLYEGFPVTGIEAQATGLPCIFSDTITKEAKLLKQTDYVSLDESPKKWADKVLAASSSDRKYSNNILRANGYDINDMAETLMEIYNRK